MEILTAILSEKWLLSATLFLMWWMERDERQKDKRSRSEERKEMAKVLHELADALALIKERLGKQ